MRRKGNELETLRFQIREQWERGVLVENIARGLGIAKTSVCYHAKKMELPPRNPRLAVVMEGDVAKLQCPSCRALLPLEEFYKRETGSFMGRCKACLNAKSIDWQQSNGSRAAATRKKSRAKNGEKYNARARAKYASASEREAAERRERKAEYRRLNPEKHKQQQARRRTKERYLPGFFTQGEWAELLEKYGSACLCCGEEKPLTVDHIIPVTRPGSSNWISNIQHLCLSCNSAKCDKVIDYRPGKSSVLPKK